MFQDLLELQIADAKLQKLYAERDQMLLDQTSLTNFAADPNNERHLFANTICLEVLNEKLASVESKISELDPTWSLSS